MTATAKEGQDNVSTIFSKCYSGYFHWGAITNHLNPVPCLLCALCQQHIYCNRVLARKFYNKSSSLVSGNEVDWFEKSLRVNFDYFQGAKMAVIEEQNF